MNQGLTLLESVLKMPLLDLPVKSCLVETKKGLVLISPIPDIRNFKNQIDAAGTVTDIVAPSGLHHLGIPQAIQLFPHATIWGAPALRKKRPDIPWQKIFSHDRWPYSEELEVVVLQGIPKLTEIVFFHKASKSLIVTDLCFNHIHGKGLGYWLMFHLFGTYKRFAMSKLFVRMIQDKNLFKESINKILDFDFQTIVISHGVNIEIHAKEAFKNALRERGF